MKIKVLSLALGGLFAAGSVFADVNAQIQQLQAQISQLQSQVNQVGTGNGKLGILETEVTQGVSTDYDHPFDLLPDTNLALALLQEQSQFKSMLTLGGYLEADAQVYGGSNHLNGLGASSSSGTDFALTTAKLYALANLNNWTQAFVTVKGGLNGASSTFSEALLNFGNLSRNPLYATIGKTYLPFGTFAGQNSMWANSLDTNAFRPVEINQLDFGFNKGGLNTAIALFNGQNNLNDFVYSLQYGKNINNFSLSGGAGYMNDIRYSGIGVGSAYATNGNAASASTPLTGGRNGAVDVNTGLAYNLGNHQSVNVNAEWDTTTNSAQFNGISTGKMQVWTLGGNYNTPIAGKNTTFGLDYSHTINMQNVPLPLPAGPVNNGNGEFITGAKSQWLAFVQNEVLSNVYLGPEFARMELYNGQYSWESTVDLSVYF